ncbi:MAG TPA: Gfo/Idh/MocA family oxidoreductase [Candidatus Stackebrandtia excrementipullorum]|nr:Gfo/Idh/MocA family oxidoreductase [Candidatus Stackebrandtia excrementipullorum]
MADDIGGNVQATNEAIASTYRAGVIGTGFMGRVHTRAIRAAGGQVTAVSGSSPEKARAFAAEIGEAVAYDDAAALFAAPDVTVVHICTPNHLHEQLAKAAVAAGKHVVCEKPLSVDADSATAMAEAAADAGLVATVPFVNRFHPLMREARQIIADGTLGRVTLAHGSYLQDWLLQPGDDNWRVKAELGGPLRAFGDIGSHWCDLLEFVTGDRIRRVSAQLSTVIPVRTEQVDTEDIAILQFATTGGAVGTTVISQVSAGRKNRMLLEVSGTEGTVSFDQEQPEVLWLGKRDRSSLLVRDPDVLGSEAARLSRVPAGHAQGYQDCFNAFVADTAAAIVDKRPDGLPDFADGARAARIAAAVLTSARTSSWVEVDE